MLTRRTKPKYITDRGKTFKLDMLATTENAVEEGVNYRRVKVVPRRVNAKVKIYIYTEKR